MRKASLILVLLLLPLGIQAQNYNVRNYGAKGDGKTLYLYDTYELEHLRVGRGSTG